MDGLNGAFWSDELRKRAAALNGDVLGLVRFSFASCAPESPMLRLLNRVRAPNGFADGAMRQGGRGYARAA
jgi:hypothetical protein